MALAVVSLRLSMIRPKIIALVNAQLHPVKTLRQFVNDRCLYRVLILALLVMNWCF
jgi:hypothetical protein